MALRNKPVRRLVQSATSHRWTRENGVPKGVENRRLSILLKNNCFVVRKTRKPLFPAGIKSVSHPLCPRGVCRASTSIKKYQSAKRIYFVVRGNKKPPNGRFFRFMYLFLRSDDLAIRVQQRRDAAETQSSRHNVMDTGLFITQNADDAAAQVLLHHNFKAFHRVSSFAVQSLGIKAAYQKRGGLSKHDATSADNKTRLSAGFVFHHNFQSMRPISCK